MMGAIAGDVVGSVHEFNGTKTKDFRLIGSRNTFTDDTIMTAAVADALLTGEEIGKKMKEWGRMYPHPAGGYGHRFAMWLHGEDSKPYGSYGNGAAMRVSSTAWLAESEADCVALARASAMPTHNHPEGIKGAEATAWTIWSARMGVAPETLREELARRYGYDLSRTCDEIRPEYCFDETCQGTCPQAFTAALEAESFEDALRLAVSLGGDADTLAAIAGSIAEARFGVPKNLYGEILGYLDEPLRGAVVRFYDRLKEKGVFREAQDA